MKPPYFRARYLQRFDFFKMKIKYKFQISSLHTYIIRPHWMTRTVNQSINQSITMRGNINRCLGLFLCLKSILCNTVLSFITDAQEIPSSSMLEEIVYQKSIQLLDSSTQTLAIYRGQEPVDAVYAFGLKYGLDRTQRDFLLQHMCSIASSSESLPFLNCTRDKALLFTTPVSSEDSTFIAHFHLYEDVEPVDAAHEFIRTYKLGIGYRNAILKETCDHVPCHRIYPRLWSYTVEIQEPVAVHPTSPRHTSDQLQQYHKVPVTIELLEGQELADVLFHTLLPWKISREQRKQIIDVAKKQGIYLQREDALVYNQSFVMNQTSLSSPYVSSNVTLTFWDNGIEPVDTLYQFLLNQFHPSFHWKNSTIEEQEILKLQLQSLVDAILIPHLCTLLPCTRTQPCIWSYPITTNHGKDMIARVLIMLDEEPIDAIDQFAIQYQLDDHYRKYLFHIACQALTCRRSTPIVFQKSLQLDDGTNLGSIQIYENEEVVDAVFRFLRSSTTAATYQHLDPITVKNTFFQLACPSPRVLCTRNIAHIFDKVIVNQNDNVPIGQLTITEFDEPVDKINEWIQLMNVSHSYLDFLVEHICSREGISCTRRKPLILTLPLRDPDGNFIGRLEVQQDEEPVDALYKFFSRHHLFEKNWDFKALVQQVCQLPPLACHRTIALKYFSDNFTMGSGNQHVGPLIIWENEEVIDKLYEKRLEFNLTVADQMKSFSLICHGEDIYCSRTRAVIYKLTGISKRDYGKFGNETCDRKYAGWQYLSTIAGSYLGSKVVPIMKHPFINIVSEGAIYSHVVMIIE